MTQAATDTQADGRDFGVSASAARRIGELLREETGDGMFMRVAVNGGGCSGFQYDFSFDGALAADDHVFERDGVRVVVDDVSLDLLDGAELHYAEELIGAFFQVRNPNAASSCGCGVSFSI